MKRSSPKTEGEDNRYFMDPGYTEISSSGVRVAECQESLCRDWGDLAAFAYNNKPWYNRKGNPGRRAAKESDEDIVLMNAETT